MQKKSRKLVFYSGGQSPGNQKIHKALAKLAGANRTKKLKITYIPVWSESSNAFFNRFVKRYKRVGFRRFTLLPIDIPVSKSLVNEAFRADVIYLAGGNTFYFLKHLKKNKILSRLKKFAKHGGIIAGLSAGAIIMTSDIGLAAYPTFDADENDVKLKKTHWKSLNLVNFEFFPHFEESPRLNKALLSYSRRKKKRVFGCKDGSGIIVNGKNIEIIGKVKIFK